MEARFGRDFSRVRLHTDDRAAASAQALGALAYTVGSHIAFAEGCYDPGTRSGLWLLAHELAHVVQQDGEGPLPPLGVGTADDPLEREADQVAGLIAVGRPLPPGFAFGAALAGVIQCHCPGEKVSAKDPSIWMAANEAIEVHYEQDFPNDVLFFGSDFDDSFLKIGPEMPLTVYNKRVYKPRPHRPGVAEVQLPKGSKRAKFGNLLLSKLRGLEKQRRPDIINFTKRAFYEIKSSGYADLGTVQLQSYYKIAEEIRRAEAPDEPPWKLETAPPFIPDSVLPMLSPDPRKSAFIVCTEATNPKKYPGMILYDVREVKKPRRAQRKAREIRIEAFDPNIAEFAPMIRALLPQVVPFYDPDSPEYVIIVPSELFSFDYFKWKAAQELNKLKVRSTFIEQGLKLFGPAFANGAGKNPFFWLTLMNDMAAVIIVPVATVELALTAVEAIAVTTAGAKAGAGRIIVEVAYEAGARAAVTSTGASAGAVATNVAGSAVATTQAMLASPVVKTVATTASAGIAIIIGNVKNAQADMQPQAGSSSAGAKPFIDQACALKVVPINTFETMAGVPSTFSATMWKEYRRTAQPAKGDFGLGRMVYYDNRPHWVIGRFSVR
jgi:hypothetical protein